MISILIVRKRALRIAVFTIGMDSKLPIVIPMPCIVTLLLRVGNLIPVSSADLISLPWCRISTTQAAQVRSQGYAILKGQVRPLRNGSGRGIEHAANASQRRAEESSACLINITATSPSSDSRTT